MSLHNPVRPSWTCAGCGDRWPCRPARGRLLAEFDGAAATLNLYMAQRFADACADLPDAPAGTLHARFLGWIHTVP